MTPETEKRPLETGKQQEPPRPEGFMDAFAAKVTAAVLEGLDRRARQRPGVGRAERREPRP